MRQIFDAGPSFVLTYNGTTMASNPVYNASSQTTALNIGSAIQELYSFDPQTGLLTNQKVKQGSTTHVDLSYDYGNLYAGGNASWKTGQLSKIIDNKVTDGSRNREYHYDKLGRLTQVKGGVNGTLWNQQYAYDRWGNRTGITQTGTSGAGGAFIPLDGLASLSYNTATNRITSTNFAYDAAGNQTQSNENGQINSYKYDAAGRLAEVSSGGLTHTYAYGASNQRLQLVEAGANGGTTLYVWEGGQVIAEYNGVGSGMAWTKSYVYLGGRLLATDSTSGIQYHHPDRLGTRLVTNTSGGVVSENIGLPFGTTIAGESYNLAGSASKKRFTSYDRSDNTKLDYAVNRHYSAAQGRFTQVDPIGMEAVNLEDPQSLNLYAYCGSDPINRTDPDGLFSLRKLFGAIGKAMKWIAIAAIVAVAILTFVAPAALASLSVWAANHATLAALLGINTPHFAIINLAATTLGASASLGFGAVIAAVSNFSAQKNKPKSQKEKEKELKEAYDIALGLLEKGLCKDAVRGKDKLDPLDRLKKLKDKITIGNTGGDDAQTTGVGDAATIKVGDKFFDEKNLDEWTAIYPVRNRTFQALILLHELSHATGRYTHDPARAGKSHQEVQRNGIVTDRVAKGCVNYSALGK